MPGESVPDNTQTDLAKHPVIKQLVKSIMGLGSIVTQLGKNQKESGDKLDKLTTFLEEGSSNGSRRKKKQNDPPPDDADDDDNSDDGDGSLSDEDINEMSQADIVRLVIKETAKVVDSKIKPVSTKLTEFEKSSSSRELSTQVKEFMKKHPDVIEWKDEISDLSKDNPRLSIARLYTLAVTENPKKAKTLKEKYKNAKVEEDDSGNSRISFGDDNSDTDDNNSDDADVSRFFGLSPTGGGKKAEKEKKGTMTPQQAVEDAWEKTMAKLPASLRGDDE